MSEFDANFNFDDDDDFFQENWSEKDWKIYLEKVDLQVSLFLDFFVSSRNIVNHLDSIALRMGWVKTESESFPDIFFNQQKDPLTIHTHPVTIATRALYHFLTKNWEIFMESAKTLDMKLCWLYSQLLHNGERNALYAISCLNAGDDALAICHFKNALQVLNFTIDIIQKIPKNSAKLKVIFQDALIACFDLREVWLKVMESCKNNDDDSDDDEE